MTDTIRSLQYDKEALHMLVEKLQGTVNDLKARNDHNAKEYERVWKLLAERGEVLEAKHKRIIELEAELKKWRIENIKRKQKEVK